MGGNPLSADFSRLITPGAFVQLTGFYKLINLVRRFGVIHVAWGDISLNSKTGFQIRG